MTDKYHERLSSFSGYLLETLLRSVRSAVCVCVRARTQTCVFAAVEARVAVTCPSHLLSTLILEHGLTLSLEIQLN